MFKSTQPDNVMTEEKSIRSPYETEAINCRNFRNPRSAPLPSKSARHSIRMPDKSPSLHRNLYHKAKNPTSEILLHEKSDQIEKTSTKFLLGEEVEELDPQILRLVVFDLENRCLRLSEQGHLKESLHVQGAIQRAREAQIEASKLEAQRAALMDISIRKGHSETDTVIFNHMNRARETNLQIKFENQMRGLLERHEKEIFMHEQEWTSEVKNRRYRQISPTLRDLRDQQQKLMASNVFDEAYKVQLVADELERIEEQNMIVRRNADFQTSLNKLLQKHKDEIDTLNKFKETKMQANKTMEKIESIPLENRKRAIKFHEDIAQDKEKLWKLKHKNDSTAILMSNNQVSKPKQLNVLTSRSQYRVLKLPPLMPTSVSTNHSRK